ncbi:hemogen [Gavia stellata]|uniref:hemogen n=1 Tax=Gavia stellata TaxID=37040 RepID=UPI0028A2865F|nr:hemogen [Gavia stellata]
MESLGKDHAYSDSSLPPSAAREEYAVPDVIITRRLRDRELLRKRKAEAQEKDSIQWVLREQENKRQRRGRGARRGRGRQPAVEPSLEAELEPDRQPDPQEEAEPAPSQLAPPEPVHQEQPLVLTVQDLVSGMQPGMAEGELAARSQDPAGEEEVLKPAEAEIPEASNTPLENDHQDNEYSTHVLF